MMNRFAFARSALAALLVAMAPLAHAGDPPLAHANDAPLLHPALWKVSRGATTIWLFGTVHALAPDTRWLEGPIADALDHADTLVTEIDAGEAASASSQLAARGRLPSGQHLAALIGPARQRALTALLARSGLPATMLDATKPWFAALVLSMLPLERAGINAEDGAEAQLAKRAGAKPRLGLEHAGDQIDLLDSLPTRTQIRLLAGAIRDFDTIVPEQARMLAAWGRGDAPALARMINADLDDAPLRQAMLTTRNHRWTQWLEARLRQPGTVFVAVGAGHLAGRDSVIADLARDGITAIRVP